MSNQIRRVEIEPAEDGGFVVTVQRKEPQRKGNGRDQVMPSYDSLRSTHVCTNTKQVGTLLGKLFSDLSSVQSKGKSSSIATGATRTDSYEGSEA